MERQPIHVVNQQNLYDTLSYISEISASLYAGLSYEEYGLREIGFCEGVVGMIELLSIDYDREGLPLANSVWRDIVITARAAVAVAELANREVHELLPVIASGDIEHYVKRFNEVYWEDFG